MTGEATNSDNDADQKVKQREEPFDFILRRAAELYNPQYTSMTGKREYVIRTEYAKAKKDWEDN
jgi:hypothetical protein